MKRGALVAALLLTTAAGPAPTRPNIVILLADDWGFTDVGAFGGEMKTPNIDALAAGGVRFSNFHVAGSCAPTRAMLQTGVSSHRAGLGNMPETIPPEHLGKPGYDAQFNDHVVTIAQRLRSAGYRTYLTGKWHLGHTPDKLPTGRGYDRAFALSQSGADNFENKPNLLLYDKA
ncbi:MAG: sulfatase-like hydrolase/transferase, partial [Sandarakinorhabdus sp.]|nr:sulfatase-like hydrolase/transferase [Sandarakinorhabdus sp.]